MTASSFTEERKFTIDASADSRDLRAMLIKQGHDVVTAAEIGPGTPDDVLLARAAQEQRVLITEDKDFGDLVFVLTEGWCDVAALSTSGVERFGGRR